MPRKPKLNKTQVIVTVNGAPIPVTLFPPQGSRKTWYAYWKGLKTRKTTGVTEYEQAVIAVSDMLNYGGGKRFLADAIMSDDEFEEIQRRHYGKKKSADARRRAEKSLGACMEAITAFRTISGLVPITKATPFDCEKFQNDALRLPKNWRAKGERTKDIETLSANTVVKWSVALQAAFERANDNAGKKCVRSVVPEEKLLKSNPWRRFTWIEGFEKKIRHFDPEELVSLLEFFRSRWADVPIAESLAKVFLWSWGRRSEIAELRWADARKVGNECHFESIGKWGVDKWFRLPQRVFEELLAFKTSSPYVFDAFNFQLREHHRNSDRPWLGDLVLPAFHPENLGYWFYERIKEWSESSGKGPAYVHIFRKTTLKYARIGEDANRLVAQDARVGEGVMMTSYVKETDEEMRQKSNRTFHRIRASLPSEVAKQFGYDEEAVDPLKKELAEATAAGNWDLVVRLGAELARRNQRAG
jgi:integrase